MAKNSRTKKASVPAEGGITPVPRNARVKTTNKMVPAANSDAPKRRSVRKKGETIEAQEEASTEGQPKSRKRGIEETGEAPAKKKGKVETKSTAERYLPAQLDDSEKEGADVKLVKKGTPNVGSGKKAAMATTTQNTGKGGDAVIAKLVKKGPANTGSGGKTAAVIDASIEIESMGDDTSSEDSSSVQDVGDEANSEGEVSSSELEVEEPVLVAEKKVAARKPSKKALENAMNEEAFFPADEQLATNPPKEGKVRVARTVKVKVEAGNDSAGDDDGEDDENNHGTSRSDAASVAARIYKKAHKMLKSKLYFESLFPVDAEKDTLPYSCWTSAISSMNEIGGDPAAARKMFYDFAYNDKLDKRISTIRNTLVTKAMNCHERYYAKDEKKSAALEDDRYIYPGDPAAPADPDLVYRNDLIWDILKQMFFTGRDTLPKLFPSELCNRINADGYIEMPETLVATAATLAQIYGLLRRDTLPPTNNGAWKFSAEAHHEVYAKHIASLKYIKSQNEVGYSVLLANIYRKASGMTNPVAPTSAMVKMNPAGLPQTYD